MFFLDWEKPRTVLVKGGGGEIAAPVSCWRSLFVTNEWNELQARRQTTPAFTLILLVCDATMVDGFCAIVCRSCSLTIAARAEKEGCNN